MREPKYCPDPDHCTYSDCPTAFCDRLGRPGADIPEAVDMLRDFEKGVEANFTGPENSGRRGWLKIQIHNIIIKLGRKPYANHE